ncbi:MAG: hypothetical protein RBR43_10040 [Desulfuromonadaceae bacterium]|nr:hypothetical protein [Desulfuromonadaceae bacterium]
MQIIETETGRVLEADGQTYPLPSLHVDAMVHVYNTPDGIWYATQERGKPRPMFAGAGGELAGQLELTADPAAILEQEQLRHRRACEQAISDYIQAEVDNYNAANDVIFRDIHSCKAYADVQDYSHQPFCAAVWAWNVDVWEAARNILTEVKSGTRATSTVDELLGELPGFGV